MDTCDPTDSSADPTTGCVITDRPAGAPCDDGVSCTQNDQCDGFGNCGGTPNDALCEDGNECTTNTCDAELDCQTTNVAAGATCDDEVSCTQNDQCDGFGNCGGTPNDALCEDGTVHHQHPATPSSTARPRVASARLRRRSLCTDDSATARRAPHAQHAPCDDGDACTTNDTCQDGTCVGGPPPDCDDETLHRR
ncbi:MAG: hypothetical protein KatS3mg076_2353 [Candidatus Binatia bacterium]|nr:MAG: hypothetical protein KatS3mg076_2353 [Candidatus Binatia bacterium]